MILCDTNILIEFYKGNSLIVQMLKQIGMKQLCISNISQAELYFGAINKKEFIQIKRHLSALRIFPVDTAVSSKFIELMEIYSLSHRLGLADALIASTAIVHQIELFTLNFKDFHFINGLKLYSQK